MVNMINAFVNNSNYNEKKVYSKKSSCQGFHQNQVDEEDNTVETNKNVNIQDIYEQLKSKTSNEEYVKKQDELVENDVREYEIEKNTDLNSQDKGLATYYEGVTLEEWALTDPKYTDPKTGISWYIRDGKYPYMVGDDAEKFQKLCQDSGEFAIKKFADMTGLIQQLDDNTVAYIGDNGIAVKSKDGKELFVDTSGISYDIIMNMFKNLPSNGDFFSDQYWLANIQNAQSQN